jgi:hypothetical protein
VVSFGAAQTRHHFVFWNADFVMSDGTLHALARHFAQGRKVILSGSLRSVSEEVEPILDELVDPATNILRMKSRDLVRLGMQHPHATLVGKTINQDLVASREPTQLLWSDFKHGLVAHFFQIFMLSIRPTRACRTANSFCDYGFIPEFCPDEPPYVVQDSDEMFLLELQNRESEAFLVGAGHNTIETIVPRYAEWSTREHRAAGRVPVVLHAGDRDEALERLQQESTAFVAALETKANEPVSHVGHRYWVWGVTDWLIERFSNREPVIPQELDLELSLEDLKNGSNFTDFEQRGYRAPAAGSPLGKAPRLSRLHPQFHSYALLAQALDAIKARLEREPEFRMLLVAPIGGWIDAELPLSHPRIFRIEPKHLRVWSLAGRSQVDLAFILAENSVEALVADWFGRIRPAIKNGGEVVVAARKSADVDDPRWIGRQQFMALSIAQAYKLGSLPAIETGAPANRSFADSVDHMMRARRARQVAGVIRHGGRALTHVAEIFGTHAPRRESLNICAQVARFHIPRDAEPYVYVVSRGRSKSARAEAATRAEDLPGMPSA